MPTTTTTFPRAIILDALDAMGLDPGAVRDSYSGRAMYGETCFGVYLDDAAQVAELVFWATALEAERWPAEFPDDLKTYQLAKALRTDGMGQSVVVYFPGVQLTN